ncbi:DUF6438 domain-containing protein [Luteimonas sp. RD2P54]|uniref:DUF6438 domain-containing protein n=1 Tax=Luteimonas endophytica TaxID=3042023 RepID=A0ABT6J6V0_9GAMM|nr:DUF6438 domain-containing protein [Luteimonas endophytica]MDH5821918.1 DUF6438 domain-containing protein [Luteimonas endophytica]
MRTILAFLAGRKRNFSFATSGQVTRSSGHCSSRLVRAEDKGSAISLPWFEPIERPTTYARRSWDSIYAHGLPAVGAISAGHTNHGHTGSGDNDVRTGSPIRCVLLSLLSAMALLGCGETAPRQPGASPLAQLPVCAEGQMAGIAPTPAEIASHRQYEVPVLTIPGPYDPERIWGLSLTLLVDESGAVACYEVEDFFGRPQAMTGERLALLRAMTAWRFKPFLQAGTAVPAIVREQIYEQRLPQHRRSMPEVPHGQVTVSLHRSGCFGLCPAYTVEIQGDGTVTYEGQRFVDVEGVHRYRIPASQVASLVEEIERKDLWSMDRNYRAPITDNPTYVLTLRLGDQTHQIEDYVGPIVGMPQVIREFQEQVDQVGRTAQWTSLSLAAVDRLRQEGFDFRSEDAADLLVRAVSNQAGDDEKAMLKLIEYGTPLQGGKSNRLYAEPVEQPLLDLALANHRLLLIAPLIQHGALETGGALDQRKLDAAFQAAIRGGRLEAVQAIWDEGGRRARPSLFFPDESDDSEHPKQQDSPVTLLLSRRHGDEGWEGRQIAQWLAARGCDLEARGASGTTLLHIAVDGDDAAFVQYLLDQEVDVNAPGEFDLPALGSASNEDIALMLLQAGSRWEMGDTGSGFLRYAREQRWGRVLAWLEDHHGSLP